LLPEVRLARLSAPVIASIAGNTQKELVLLADRLRSASVVAST
jgi:hypothetical protein